MKRTCLALDLVDDPQLIEAYERYHQSDNVWLEIVKGIRNSGIDDMQIYRIGVSLFMIVDYNENLDLKQAFATMGSMPRQVEWAQLMAQFQRKITAAKPDELWAEMKPVFLLKNCKS